MINTTSVHIKRRSKLVIENYLSNPYQLQPTKWVMSAKSYKIIVKHLKTDFRGLIIQSRGINSGVISSCAVDFKSIFQQLICHLHDCLLMVPFRCLTTSDL